MLWRIVAGILFAVAAALPAHADQAATGLSKAYDFAELPPAAPEAPKVASEALLLEIYREQWTNYQRQLQEYNRHRERRFDMEIKEIAMLCGLTIVALVIVLGYLRRTPGFRAEHAVHAAGFIFIIQATLTLVMMAETEQQLAAASGILGAVAGYLFGTLRRPTPGAPEEAAEASKAQPTAAR